MALIPPIVSKTIWDFSPLNISGCQLWLDGADTSTVTVSGNNVTQWTDKSGVANNATGAANHYPTGSVSSISFAASLYLTTSYTSNPTAETVFAVVTPTSLTATTYYNILGSTASGGRQFGTYGQAPVVSKNPSTNILSGANISTNTIILLEMTYSVATTAAIYENGNLQTGTPTTDTFSGTGTTRIGDLNGSGFIGNINEIICYNSVLSSEQRQQVEGYLFKKWNLLNPAPPSTHPYTSSLTKPFSRVFIPPDILGCQLWLDGADASTLTGSSISQWTDKSGVANNATATANYPTSTIAGNVTFALGQSLSTSYTSNPTAETVFAVVTPTSLINSGYYNILGSSASGGRQFGTYGPAPTVYTMYATILSGATSISTNTIILLEMTYSGANTAAIYENGNLQTGSLTLDTFSGTGTTIIGSGFIGNINEIICYDSVLTTQQRQQVEGYLFKKWNLLNPAPPTKHPYSIFPPSSITPYIPRKDNASLWVDSSKYAIASTNNLGNYIRSIYPCILSSTVITGVTPTSNISVQYLQGSTVYTGVSVSSDVGITTLGGINQTGTQYYLTKNPQLYGFILGANVVISGYPNPRNNGTFKILAINTSINPYILVSGYSAISAISGTAGVVTVTVLSTDGFKGGAQVTIANVGTITAFNGTYIIASVNNATNQFTYLSATTGTGTVGTSTTAQIQLSSVTNIIQTISTISGSAGVVTVTVGSTAGFAIGGYVNIATVGGTGTGYNGYFPIASVISTSQFTYLSATTGTGTVTSATATTIPGVQAITAISGNGTNIATVTLTSNAGFVVGGTVVIGNVGGSGYINFNGTFTINSLIGTTQITYTSNATYVVPIGTGTLGTGGTNAANLSIATPAAFGYIRLESVSGTTYSTTVNPCQYGLFPGMPVTISGFNNAGNNGTFTIAAIQSNSIQVYTTSQVSETLISGTSGTISVPGRVTTGDIQISQNNTVIYPLNVDPSLLGYSVNSNVTISGYPNQRNNGTFVITGLGTTFGNYYIQVPLATQQSLVPFLWNASNTNITATPGASTTPYPSVFTVPSGITLKDGQSLPIATVQPTNAAQTITNPNFPSWGASQYNLTYYISFLKDSTTGVASTTNFVLSRGGVTTTGQYSGFTTATPPLTTPPTYYTALFYIPGRTGYIQLSSTNAVVECSTSSNLPNGNSIFFTNTTTYDNTIYTISNVFGNNFTINSSNGLYFPNMINFGNSLSPLTPNANSGIGASTINQFPGYSNLLSPNTLTLSSAISFYNATSTVTYTSVNGSCLVASNKVSNFFLSFMISKSNFTGDGTYSSATLGSSAFNFFNDGTFNITDFSRVYTNSAAAPVYFQAFPYTYVYGPLTLAVNIIGNVLTINGFGPLLNPPFFIGCPVYITGSNGVGSGIISSFGPSFQRITQISGDGTTVTVKVGSTASFVVGGAVIIANVGTITAFNGTYIIASVSTNQFTYLSSTTGTGLVLSGASSIQNGATATLPQIITQLTATGSVVTVTVGSAGSFVVGGGVVIANVTGGTPSYNGTYIIASVISTTQFTYASTSVGAATLINTSTANSTFAIKNYSGSFSIGSYISFTTPYNEKYFISPLTFSTTTTSISPSNGFITLSVPSTVGFNINSNILISGTTNYTGQYTLTNVTSNTITFKSSNTQNETGSFPVQSIGSSTPITGGQNISGTTYALFTVNDSNQLTTQYRAYTISGTTTTTTTIGLGNITINGNTATVNIPSVTYLSAGNTVTLSGTCIDGAYTILTASVTGTPASAALFTINLPNPPSVTYSGTTYAITAISVASAGITITTSGVLAATTGVTFNNIPFVPISYYFNGTTTGTITTSYYGISLTYGTSLPIPVTGISISSTTSTTTATVTLTGNSIYIPSNGSVNLSSTSFPLPFFTSNYIVSTGGTTSIIIPVSSSFTISPLLQISSYDGTYSISNKIFSNPPSFAIQTSITGQSSTGTITCSGIVLPYSDNDTFYLDYNGTYTYYYQKYASNGNKILLYTGAGLDTSIYANNNPTFSMGGVLTTSTTNLFVNFSNIILNFNNPSPDNTATPSAYTTKLYAGCGWTDNSGLLLTDNSAPNKLSNITSSLALSSTLQNGISSTQFIGPSLISSLSSTIRTSNFSIFVVCYIPPSSGSIQTIFANDTFSINLQSLQIYVNYSNYTITSPITSGWHILSSLTLSQIINLNIDGMLAATSLYSIRNDIQSPWVMGTGFTGQIGELMVLNTTISPSRCQQVEGYLAWKWGIQLPSSHAYYKSSP